MCALYFSADAAVRDVFRSHFATLIEAINPDDLTHKLYSSALITAADMSTIDTPQNSYMKNTILLMAVDRAIVIHDKNFETFLTIMKSVQKYEPLCETMSADAKQLGKKSRV